MGEPEPDRGRRRRAPWGALVFLSACLLALVAVRWHFGGVAPTPPAFAGETTLAEALDRSEATGKPVLALATADWCGPCQAFKRGALADPRVTEWIERHTVPATVDLTDERDPAAREGARLLGVSAIPALVLLEGGDIVARVEGALSTEKLLAWLKSKTATGAPVAPTPED